MASYREILRLNSMGISQRRIAASLQCSRNTASEVLSRAARQGLTWPLQDDLLGCTGTSDCVKTDGKNG